MVKIWRYVLATDNGLAPCIDNGVLSLCCCKPRIRKGANVGDYVMGFMPIRFARKGPLLAWVGVISEKLTMGDYQAKYPDRQDAIYKRDGYHSDGRENLSHNGGDYHLDPANQTRDKNGIYALLCKPFWYWGGTPFPVPENFHFLTHHFVGEANAVTNPSVLPKLRDWLGSLEPGIHGQPRNIPASSPLQSCNQSACSIEPKSSSKKRRNPTPRC